MLSMENKNRGKLYIYLEELSSLLSVHYPTSERIILLNTDVLLHCQETFLVSGFMLAETKAMLMDDSIKFFRCVVIFFFNMESDNQVFYIYKG